MATSKSATQIRKGMPFMIALLVIQFIIGMYLNLYIQLPASHPGTQGSYAPSIPWALAGNAGIALALHVAIWILLTLGSVAFVVRSILAHHKSLIVGSTLGLLSILIAGSGGLTFLNRGGANSESFIMALGFILALTAYGVTYYKTNDNKS